MRVDGSEEESASEPHSAIGGVVIWQRIASKLVFRSSNSCNLFINVAVLHATRIVTGMQLSSGHLCIHDTVYTFRSKLPFPRRGRSYLGPIACRIQRLE